MLHVGIRHVIPNQDRGIRIVPETLKHCKNAKYRLVLGNDSF